MKLTCYVIGDLLPLYAENIASSDTRMMVEEHIASCEHCKKELEKLRMPSCMPIDINVAPLKKVKSTLRKKKYLTIIFSVLLTLSMVTIIMGYLMAPEYIQYSEDAVSITEINQETVLAKFSNEVSGYDINKYLADDHSGYVYHITAWNSFWNRNILKSTAPNIVLNPNGEEVTAVYYYLTDGSQDILIYGKDENTRGGVVTLPRLFLTHYALYALILAVICYFILIICRKNEKVKNTMAKILCLPIAYLLSHIFIKGFTGVAYSATRDLYAILLVMIPVYCALLVAMKLVKLHFTK